MKVQRNIGLVGAAVLLLATLPSAALAQRHCYWVDGVRQCDGGTTVILPHRTGDYMEDYGRRRQIRKAQEADEADALDRRACRQQAVEAANARDYKRAKALAEICP